MVRFIQIIYVFSKARLDERFSPRALRLLAASIRLVCPSTWFYQRQMPYPERLRHALEHCGPLFVKFGQLLSSRRDLFEDDIVDSLSRLQDQATPFPVKQARQMIEAALGRPIDECYARFDDEPLAAASISQVHSAQLMTGEEVIVKVLRPHIERRVRRDTNALGALARLIEKFFPSLRRFKPTDIVAEIERVLLLELNLKTEGANASLLRHHFAQAPLIYVPKVYWPFTKRNVMTMERIYGIRITDIEKLDALGVDKAKLAKRGVEIFFTQAFTNGFFHADMHPGNVFVDATNPGDPQYVAIDFGIMGTLSETDQYYLAANFMAFFERDYRRVATLHVESGWIAPETNIDQFESTIRTLCEPIFGKPFKDISFAECLAQLFEAARTFDMRIQPQLLLLQKTLFNIEGLGRQLYPELDLWTTAKPFLERWRKERYSVKRFVKLLKERAPKWFMMLKEHADDIR